MKKTKLLLASPVLIAPFIATIPFTTTSCHKYKTDFGKLEEYVDHEIVSDGSSAFVHLSVKSDQKDRYLPNQLNSVSTNGRKLTPIETTNGREGYYTYTLLDNNKTAILYIFDYQGNIQIDAETATLKSISAQGYDVTGSDVAEFEVGEYLNSETTSKRITITATLSNGDQIDLDHDDLTFTIGDHKAGSKFTDTETKKQGTVKFQDKTDTFEYQVNKKTTAYYSYTNSTTWKTKVDKYTTATGWMDAIDEYNKVEAKEENNGYYVIGLPDGKYTLTKNIEIKQKNNQALLLEAVGEVTFDESQFIYPVEFNADGTAYTFSIVGDTTATETEVGISGIKFTNNQKDVSLVTLSKNAHDVVFDDCGFYNNGGLNITGVSGVSSPTAVADAAQTITILDCTGQYLDVLYKGGIYHDDYSPYDLIISNSSIWNSNQLFNVNGLNIDAYIYNVFAQVMGEATPKSAMIIDGTGYYTFIDSEFVQINKAGNIGFVELTGGNGLEDKVLTFFHCSLLRTLSETELNDVINNSSFNGVNWTISWTGFDDETQSGLVYSNPTEAGQSKVWSHK